MKRLLTSVLLATSVVGGFCLMGSHLGQAVAAADPGGETPQRVDDFRLTDTNLIGQQLSRFSDASAVVIVTYGNGCPIVRNSVAALNALKAKYAGKGVEFLALDSTPQDTRDAVKAEAKEYGLDMPVMMDTNQLVGEQMGVTRTAEVFVINPKTWRVMYRGPVDDRVTYERQKAEASEHWADDAIAATLAHQPVAVTRRPAQGCLVSFSATADKAAFSKISYAHDVAPIVSEKCVSCHQPGGIGPMPLTSYEQIKGYSPMIREVIRTRRMPPWHADPTVGHFMDDKSLSPTQIKTLVHWVEAGSPRGEGADPLKGKTYAVQEWPLGKPDVILDVPAYTIPASGVVDYQRPFIVNPLTKPEWLKASTIKVSNRQGVHHILTGLLTDVPTEGYASETKWGASVGGYAVGSESVKEPKDIGVYLPTGGAIGFQNHYTPYGKPAEEKSQIALYFYKNGETPKYVMHNIAVADPSIVIGPNEEAHYETAYLEFPHEAILYGAFPHAHYRGRSSDVYIKYPDGSQKLLLALPKYDFNWQREYTFAEPLKVPAGSKIIVHYTYDNSKRNPANPDPNRTVPWGDQSFDEMLYTALRYRWVDETSAKMLPQYDKDLQANRMMGMFDDNGDGFIEPEELKGAMGAGLKKNFALIDRNHDGKIDKAELAAVQAYMNRPRPAPTASQTATAPTAAPAPKPVASVAPLAGGPTGR